MQKLAERLENLLYFLDVGIDRNDEFLTKCSWYKNVRVAKRNWVEIDEAIEQMKLFSAKGLTQLSHDVCILAFMRMSVKLYLSIYIKTTKKYRLMNTAKNFVSLN